MASPLIIRNTQSPGDIIVLSAAIRDMHLRHPGKFDTSICVSPGAEHAYTHNPNIRKAVPAPGRGLKGKPFVAHYPLIRQCNQQRKHFLWGFIEHMNSKLHTDIKLTDFRPDLHLSPQDVATPLIEPPYWVFLAGGKTDFRTKIWSRKYWQQVVSSTKGDIRWVQCGGGSKNHILHEKIDGVYSYMVKQTGLRDFMRLIYHADGVVSVVTAAMHIAAAFNKPCVVIAGGREPWWWEAYTNKNRLYNMRVGTPHWQIPAGDNYVEHEFLHTMDKLPCCMNKGCWRAKLSGKTTSLCKNIVEIDGQRLPKCKAMITPDQVVESVLGYYKRDMVGQRKLTVPGRELSVAYCLYGSDTKWLETIKPLMPEDDVTTISTDVDRMTAIRQAIALDKEWILWFEEGSMPASNNWFRFVKAGMSISAVKGRVYKTKDGKLYPHPACFITPTSLLNKNATSFQELFSKLERTRFTQLDSEINLRTERPCLAQTQSTAVTVT